jgi:hypothetical protein
MPGPSNRPLFPVPVDPEAQERIEKAKGGSIRTQGQREVHASAMFRRTRRVCALAYLFPFSDSLFGGSFGGQDLIVSHGRRDGPVANRTGVTHCPGR